MPTILLVDDARVSREALAKILRLDGYTVVCAGDGIEALDALREYPTDLVLLDLMMPRLDGVGFLAELRSQKTGDEHLPVIILTAAGDPDTIASAGRLGARTCLIKSRFTMPELLAQIRAHLIPLGSLGIPVDQHKPHVPHTT